jgi:hypothetical protein
MDWGSLFATIYLLGALFTAAVTASPIRAVMGADRPGDHADADSASDARMIVLFVVTGVAAIWPCTLPMYLLSRFIPASADDEADHGVELVMSERYGRPE